MKLWIARDEDGDLNLFDVKPQKFKPDHYSMVWTVHAGGYINQMNLDKSLFPSVTFETSPQQVEIKLINNE